MSSGTAESCPRCGEPRIGPFCERCGHSYSAPTPPETGSPPAGSQPTGSQPTGSPPTGPPPTGPPPTGSPPTGSPPTGSPPTGPLATSSWWVVIAPDRDYFEAGGKYAGKFTFPASSSPWRVELTGTSVRIGKRSASRGITPEIDLASPPVDPGVSRQHARLLAQPDGSWALVDEGSTNGTYLNGGSQRIPANQPVPLADGDRVHLGVWTTITLRSR